MTLKYFIANSIEPDEYMNIRQYDISFNIKEFVKIKKSGWDLNTVKSFLQSGISYTSTEKAMSMGIQKLDKFQIFQRNGYSFEDYLQAFENNVLNVSDYSYYKTGYKKGRLLIGIGGAAD